MIRLALTAWAVVLLIALAFFFALGVARSRGRKIQQDIERADAILENLDFYRWELELADRSDR